jgi:plastin-1
MGFRLLGQSLHSNYYYLTIRFKQSDIDIFVKQFEAFDLNGTGRIPKHQLLNACKNLGEGFSDADISNKMGEFDLHKNNYIEFEQFLQLVSKLREGKLISSGSGYGSSLKQGKFIQTKGATDATAHSISEEEQEQFTIHINQSLKGDADLSSYLPIHTNSFSDLYNKCKDGLVLSKLINYSVPDTIDERALNKGQMNAFQQTENNNVVINSAKAIGCSVVNIGSQDLIEGREHLVLGLVWQIIKIGLFAKVDLKFHPELFRLLEASETLDDLLKLPTDQILLRWFNYHLKKANSSRKVANFSSDIKDSVNYTTLLHQLAPDTCALDPLNKTDLFDRAEAVLQNADKLGCRSYVTPKSICSGNPKLNLAFVANLFNNHPGLEPLSDVEKAALDEWLFNSQGDREARAFALWLNSLGVDPFVSNLYNDLRNGIVLLQAFDKVKTGCVNWKQVNQGVPMSRFKQVENTNYCVVLGKSLNFSLVGIQGADITDGSRTLTLSIVWQLMRENIVQILKTLTKGGKDITDADIVSWANDVVKRQGKTSSMANFGDSSLKNGIFFLDLLNGIKKGIVNYDLVSRSTSENDYKNNAKYAISIARKLGATIFILPEDILESKSKMILTFVGALMAVDKALIMAGAGSGSQYNLDKI